MSVTIDYDDRRGYVYECRCGWHGQMPSIYSDAALIEVHLRDCGHRPTQQPPPTPRAARGVRNSTAKLTAELVREIRRRHANGETQMAIAELFGVSGGTTSKIIRRITWADVD